MKILAVDYGERRTGIAVTDDLGITAQGLKTIEIKDECEVPEKLEQVVKEVNAGKIVFGLPLNMDGTESRKSLKVRKFGILFAQRVSLPVDFFDERMTSMQAHRVMNETNTKIFGNKSLIDRISATLILQDYMKSHP